MPSQDLYMQWYPIEITTGANSTSVEEVEITTGLSIRGNYAWLIHKVEFYFDQVCGAAADNTLIMVLSTVSGSATFPTVSDKGVICRMNKAIIYQTSGVTLGDAMGEWESLPPTIIASPKLSLYAGTGPNDDAAFQSKTWYGRIGYTTVPIDQKTYLEIAETFETL